MPRPLFFSPKTTKMPTQNSGKSSVENQLLLRQLHLMMPRNLMQNFSMNFTKCRTQTESFSARPSRRDLSLALTSTPTTSSFWSSTITFSSGSAKRPMSRRRSNLSLSERVSLRPRRSLRIQECPGLSKTLKTRSSSHSSTASTLSLNRTMVPAWDMMHPSLLSKTWIQSRMQGGRTTTSS